MDIDIPFSEACERNKGPILEVLQPYFNEIRSLLEVGTGTAQHAIHFAKAHPNLTWQCADQQHYLDGINAQLAQHKLKNVMPPFELDVKQAVWADSALPYDAIYTANTFHIMTQAEVEQFFEGLPMVLTDLAYLFVYGPFKYDGKFTSESNASFDQTLRSRGCGSAIRDFEKVNDLANSVGFKLIVDQSMPANNQCLIWQQQP